MEKRLYQNVKKGARAIALVGLVALAGCGGDKDREKNNIRELSIDTRAHLTRAFDGSKVFVIPDSSGGFSFYRDLNNDDFADTYGRGFYMLGLSRTLDERNLSPEESRAIRMRGLVNTYHAIIDTSLGGSQ